MNDEVNKFFSGYIEGYYGKILSWSDRYKIIKGLKKNNMNFYSWEKNQALFVNKFGMLEPRKTKIKIPHFILIPVLAFDKYKYRLGYGKGFYDRYLKKLKKRKKIITIGLAYSFQKVKKIPINKYDIKLDFIITEKLN